MDGKHVLIEAPAHSGTEYFNYKGTFSIVLFALVDANYLFTFVNVGCQGRISDGGVFRNTNLYQMLNEETLKLPTAKALPGRNNAVPYVIVADDAFALGNHIMKPYPGMHDKGTPQRIFNYRLSRARRVVENVFGIMASVFRIFRRPMLLDPEKASLITMTCALLHNFLRKSKLSKFLYTPVGSLDYEVNGELVKGTWRNEVIDISSLIPLQNQPRRPSLKAKEIRTEFMEYFQSECGKVPWQ